MTRLIPTLLCLACSTPTLPAPGEWHSAALPPGVLARADLATGRVEYSLDVTALPAHAQAAVILHEACHLRGHTSEDGADCCAARLYAELYGVAAVPRVIEWWISVHQWQRAVVWAACSEGWTCR